MTVELATLDDDISGLVSVAAFIGELRQELTVAVASDQGHELRFGLGNVAVEMSVVVSRAGGGGVRLWVIPVGSKQQQPSPHKIMLNLAPVQADFRPGEAISDNEDETYARQTNRPVVVERKNVPQELIDRYAEKPGDYR
jgi:hypothetical protein